MLRGASRHPLFAVALCAFVLALPRSAARAHGPAPAALGVLAWDGTQVDVVRLNVGLARRVEGERFRFVCPALWGDERAAPAAPLASGELLLAASSGLFLLSAQGAPRPHPDPNARGAVVDLVQAGDSLYALRVAGGKSELLAVDAERARAVWSDATVFFSIASDDQRLLLLRSSELSLAWQWLDLSGVAQDAGELALPAPVEYAFARLSRALPYALVLEQGRPELGRLEGSGWVSVAKAAASIAGPIVLEDVELLAIDGQLAQLGDAAAAPLGEGPYVSCLDQLGELSYACTRAGLARLSASGVGESLFEFSQLAPPDLGAAEDEEQREQCDYQWQDLRFDLLALGVEVSLDPEPAPDAGLPEDGGLGDDRAADASAAPRTRRSGGCSAQPIHAPQPLLALLAGALFFARLRRYGTRSCLSRPSAAVNCNY
jgi:hypothetical protein